MPVKDMDREICRDMDHRRQRKCEDRDLPFKTAAQARRIGRRVRQITASGVPDSFADAHMTKIDISGTSPPAMTAPLRNGRPGLVKRVAAKRMWVCVFMAG